MLYVKIGALVCVIVMLAMLAMGPRNLDARGGVEVGVLSLLCGIAWPIAVVLAVCGVFMYLVVNITTGDRHDG